MQQALLCALEQKCRRRQIKVQARQWRKNGTCRIPWMSVAPDFPDPRECLAAFLVFGSAEVLAGVKPANLVRISNRTVACGRNMYELWHALGSELMQESHLEVMPLVESTNSTLLLLYDPALLSRRLSSRGVATFLLSLGYSSLDSAEKVLVQLCARFCGTDLPHEIGIFLGYPLKDVTAFMGRTNLPVSSQRLWKIYGRGRRSEALADLYQRHHTSIARQLRTHKGASFTLLRGENPGT